MTASPTVEPHTLEPHPVKKPDVDVYEERFVYPTGLKLALISLALCLANFIVALDNTIIAVAIPKITDQFHSLDDIGWYGSAYLLTTASFQLLFGRLYTFLSQKWVYIGALALFELGSLICGVAPSSTALVIGRAIAGLGCSGLSTGTLTIVVDTVPLEKRSMYMGLVAAVYWMGSVAGPLIGGALTDKVSWRWCFYINLPIGVVTAVVIIAFFKPPRASKKQSIRLLDLTRKLDPWGTIAFVPGIICLLLALQWGGSKYPWSNGRIIALFALFGLLMAAFIGIQIWKQEEATVPPRILKQRDMLAAAWFALCLSGSFLALVYILPIYFQAIKGVIAVKSGIDNLPMILSVVTSSLLAGAAITTVGYYTPFMILAAVLTAVGAGLLSTLTVATGHAHWIGYQVIYGFGVGVGIQQPLLVAQNVLRPLDVATGNSLVLLMGTLGGSMFISVSQNVFRSTLIKLVARIPGVDPALVLNTGATSLRSAVAPELLPAVLVAYNKALMSAIYVCVAVAALSTVGALATKWRSVKGEKESVDGELDATMIEKNADRGDAAG
ncbi:putative MFS multidrug transporter [Mycena latifolia]|nr:putative MFS multidrug transporter [Mycena latifolia]